MNTGAKIKCPKCGRKCKRGAVDVHYCPICRMQFDDDPDEGGDYHHSDPSRRMQREEEMEATKHRKRG